MNSFDLNKKVEKGKGFFHTSSLRKWEYIPTDNGPEKVHTGNQTPLYFKYDEETTYQDVVNTMRRWYFEAMWGMYESGHTQLATFFDIPERILIQAERLALVDYHDRAGRW